jgi:hypothetical protein
MSNSLLVIVLVLGFAAVAGLFVALTVRDAGGWRKKLDNILLPIGFERCEAEPDKAAIAQRLRIVNPRHQGKRIVMHHYRRAAPGADFTVHVCDYHFASASGKARGGNWLLVCLVAPALDLPRLSIDNIPQDSGMASRLMRSLADTLEMPGMVRVPCGEAELDRRFHLYAQDPQAASAIAPLLLHELAASTAGASVDTLGDTVALCSIPMLADRTRQVLDGQKLQGLVYLAQRLVQALPRH